MEYNIEKHVVYERLNGQILMAEYDSIAEVRTYERNPDYSVIRLIGEEEYIVLAKKAEVDAELKKIVWEIDHIELENFCRNLDISKPASIPYVVRMMFCRLAYVVEALDKMIAELQDELDGDRDDLTDTSYEALDDNSTPDGENTKEEQDQEKIRESLMAARRSKGVKK